MQGLGLQRLTVLSHWCPYFSELLYTIDFQTVSLLVLHFPEAGRCSGTQVAALMQLVEDVGLTEQADALIAQVDAEQEFAGEEYPEAEASGGNGDGDAGSGWHDHSSGRDVAGSKTCHALQSGCMSAHSVVECLAHSPLVRSVCPLPYFS